MNTRPEDGHRQPDAAPGCVMSERPRLINVAYRLLGSLADAEDVVQETYARWYALSRPAQKAIASPGAWMTTVASRICLDLLGSARIRRERYVGEWIPEPLPEPARWSNGRSGAATDPAEHVTLDESVSMAFLVVLDSMTPAERVSFILHDVFRYPFAQVAQIVGRTPAACRQLASSGRRRLDEAHAAPTPTAQQAEIVRHFKKAWASKDIGALISLLDPSATATADGGGRTLAAPAPIHGADEIAHHYLTLATLTPTDVTLEECLVNGRPGLVQLHQGVATTVFAFDLAGDRIKRIWAVRNPDKLRTWHKA
jgi:RNA polymerase sigma-70 factor (ECF subfamily)